MQGRKWNVEVNGYVLKQCRSRLDINLMKVGENNFELLRELSDDVVLLGACLWICCERQAQAIEAHRARWAPRGRLDASTHVAVDRLDAQEPVLKKYIGATTPLGRLGVPGGSAADA